MDVIIGVDPHKASHHAFAIDDREQEVAQVSIRATKTQAERLLAWAQPFDRRTWAIEGVDRPGYLLSQQLLAAGERVVDVPATLAARTRVLGAGRSSKTDPNDARAVAITALRHTTLREVVPVGHGEVLRLLAKRNTDIGNQRCRVVSRLHALLVELAPGGIAKEINASDVDAFLGRVSPATPAEQVRYDLAVELLGDVRRLDEQLKTSHKRIRAAVTASATSVTDVFGVGPIIAAMLIGYTGDIGRFANRDHYAAYNGTAAGGVLLGRSDRASAVPAREPHPQPCAAHGSHLSAPSPPFRRTRLLRAARRRGKDEQGSDPGVETQISNTVYRQLVLDTRHRAG